MNVVEIEEAVSRLAEATFDAEEFPFVFPEAFGNKRISFQLSGISGNATVLF